MVDLMEVKKFYTVKSVLMKLLDEWLNDNETMKIEIYPIYNDEFSTWLWRASEREPIKVFKPDSTE